MPEIEQYTSLKVTLLGVLCGLVETSCYRGSWNQPKIRLTQRHRPNGMLLRIQSVSVLHQIKFRGTNTPLFRNTYMHTRIDLNSN